MPRLFNPQLEDGRIKRVREDEFFRIYQKPLLWMVNSEEGRDMMGIDKAFPEIHAIGPNFFRHDNIYPLATSPTGWWRESKSQYRTYSTFANNIRIRWEAWQEYLSDYYIALYMQEMPKKYVPEYAMVNGVPAAVMHTTSTFFPDADPESTSVDGHAWEQYGLTSGVTWATIIADAGTNAEDAAGDNLRISINSDNVSDRWIRLYRGILLYDIGSIASGDSIDSAEMSIFGVSKADTFSPTIGPDINVYQSAPASNTAVVAGDFNSLSATAFSTAITHAGFDTTDYNDFTLNASGLSLIETAQAGDGIVKLGIRNANYDVAANAPTWTSQKLANLVSRVRDTETGNEEPKLVIEHTGAAAVVPIGNLLLMGAG